MRRIAVVGGTGAEGSGLAFRWAAAGYDVTLGSRDAAKASAMADELNGQLGSRLLKGCGNEEAVSAADVVVLTVPFAAQKSTAAALRGHLRGKLLIDVTVPLAPPKVAKVSLPNGRSAVEQLQEELGPEVRVVSAFQNISAHHLRDLDWKGDCDVLVCGDAAEDRDVAVELAAAAGFRAIHAGVLANSAAAEAMTSVLIAINRRYKVSAAGIRITGIEAFEDGAAAAQVI